MKDEDIDFSDIPELDEEGGRMPISCIWLPAPDGPEVGVTRDHDPSPHLDRQHLLHPLLLGRVPLDRLRDRARCRQHLLRPHAHRPVTGDPQQSGLAPP